MNNITLALMTGVDIPIPEVGVAIHQPTIKEMSLIGEMACMLGAQTLCVSKSIIQTEDKSLLDNTTNFQIFIALMFEKEMGEKKQAVLDLMQLIFPQHQAVLTPNSILLTQPNSDPIMIDDNNFEILQEYVKQIFCLNGKSDSQAVFNPGGAKAQEIAAKLMRGRERVAAQKGPASSSIYARYISIITIGFQSMSLKDALDLTLFQLTDLMERYSLHISWDMDIKMRLAGGKPEGKTPDWMQDIH